jgi:16S rRNA (guanine1516-N2)-methyltransferase
VLEKINDRLVLFSKNDKKQKPICVDFVEGKMGYRHRVGGKELIARAVGIKKNQPLTIIDATAGLGRDAFILASLGCEIILLERSSLMADLLEDGLRRGSENSMIKNIISRMTLVRGDANASLNNLVADVVYLDPMYPHREKTALVKKDMRILREYLGDDDDANYLLNKALESAKKRVVVKRSKHAEYLNSMTPQLSMEGKSSRFDIYLKKDD